jgi:hypothetical protein
MKLRHFRIPVFAFDNPSYLKTSVAGLGQYIHIVGGSDTLEHRIGGRFQSERSKELCRFLLVGAPIRSHGLA